MEGAIFSLQQLSVYHTIHHRKLYNRKQEAQLLQRSVSVAVTAAVNNSVLATCDTTNTTVLRPFFQDHPAEPVPEENFWTLWCKGKLTEANTQTIRLGATPSRLTSAHLHHLPIFYRLDDLPAAQPCQSTEGN